MRKHNLKPEDISTKTPAAEVEKPKVVDEMEESQNHISCGGGGGRGSGSSSDSAVTMAWSQIKRDDEGKVIIPGMKRLWKQSFF